MQFPLVSTNLNVNHCFTDAVDQEQLLRVACEPQALSKERYQDGSRGTGTSSHMQ